MAIRIRWFPFGFAAVAILASLPFAWLLASYLRGFGVPVVVAALVGLLLVPAALVAAALLAPILLSWPYRRRAGHVRPAQLANGDAQDPALLMEIGERMRAFERGALVRVIGIGQAQVVSGTLAELLAIEVRETGAQLSLRLKGEALASRPFEPSFPHPILEISDGAGTRYLVAPGGGGGGDGEWRFDVPFFPAPPREVRRLTLAVPAVVDQMPLQPPRGPIVEGPWHFEVEL